MTGRYSVAFLALCLFVGCGGGGYHPQPLKHHFDEKHIAGVEVSKKEAMLKERASYERARNAHLKAEADLKKQETTLKVVQGERKEADIRKRAADDKRKAAEESEDLNRINPAMREHRVADLQRRAADKKIAAAKAREKQLKAIVVHAATVMYLHESRFEVAKAMVARNNNIAPRGIIFERFETQVKKRTDEVAKARPPPTNARKPLRRPTASGKSSTKSSCTPTAAHLPRAALASSECPSKSKENRPASWSSTTNESFARSCASSWPWRATSSAVWTMVNRP